MIVNDHDKLDKVFRKGIEDQLDPRYDGEWSWRIRWAIYWTPRSQFKLMTDVCVFFSICLGKFEINWMRIPIPFPGVSIMLILAEFMLIKYKGSNFL